MFSPTIFRCLHPSLHRCSVAVREEGVILPKITSIFIYINIGFSFDLFIPCFGTATLQRRNTFLCLSAVCKKGQPHFFQIMWHTTKKAMNYFCSMREIHYLCNLNAPSTNLLYKDILNNGRNTT